MNGLSTPDLIPSMGGSEMKVPGILDTQCSGRGKRLTVPEEEALVRITRQSMDDYDVEACQKRFWTLISKMLEIDTGRSYSWQSCRRRMTGNVASRLAHRSSVRSGLDPPKDDMHPMIAEKIDWWLDMVDAKNAKIKEQEEAKLQQHWDRGKCAAS